MDRVRCVAGVLLGIAGTFLLFTWLFPYGASAYHLEVGGRALLKAEDVASTERSDALMRATGHLEAALRWRSDNAQAYRLLGQVALLQQNLDKAAQSFASSTALRPENSLAWWELIQVYRLMADREAQEAGAPARSTAMESLAPAWQSAGLSGQDALRAFDAAWRGGRYRETITWYRLAEEIGGAPFPPAHFSAVVAFIVAHSELPEGLDHDLVLVYPLDEVATIEGESLQWLHADPNYGLKPGDRLVDHPSLDPTVGVMWWSGTAIAVVDVQHEADYAITVRAKHSNEMPGQVQVEHNLFPLFPFFVGPDWQESSGTVSLSPGVHIIGISYLRDDGDLAVDWVHLQSGTAPR